MRERINGANSKIQNFNDRESLFRQQASEYESLKKVDLEFKPYEKLWNQAMTFVSYKLEWETGPFLKQSYI